MKLGPYSKTCEGCGCDYLARIRRQRFCKPECAGSCPSFTPDYRKAIKLKAYGLTLEQYNKMYDDQGGVCKICGKPETSTINGVILKLAVDHDHENDRVRGLLCHKCNRGLGLFGDSSERLRIAALYLEAA